MKSLNIVILSLLTITMFACTRDVDKPTKISIKVPESYSPQGSSKISMKPGPEYMLGHIVLNVRGAGIPNVEVFHWDLEDECPEEDSIGTTCFPTAPSTVEMLVPSGPKIIQYLGVYINMSEEMLFTYGANGADVGPGDNAITIVTSDFGGGSSVMTKISGQYVAEVVSGKGHGPSGRIEASFDPPAGTVAAGFPMVIQYEEMFDGWGTLFSISGVPFQYNLVNPFNGNRIPLNIDANNLLSGGLNQGLLAVRSPATYYNGQSGDSDRREQGLGQFIYGFYGPAANQLSSPTACYPAGPIPVNEMWNSQSGGSNIDFVTSPDPNNLSVLGGGTESCGGVEYTNLLTLQVQNFDDGMHDVPEFYGPFAETSLSFTDSSCNDYDLFRNCYDDSAGTVEFQWNYLPGVFNAVSGIDGVTLFTKIEPCTGYDYECMDQYEDHKVDSGIRCNTLAQEGFASLGDFGSGTTSFNWTGVSNPNNDMIMAFLCPYKEISGVRKYLSSAADTSSGGMSGGGPVATKLKLTGMGGDYPYINQNICTMMEVQALDDSDNFADLPGGGGYYNADFSSAVGGFYYDPSCSSPISNPYPLNGGVNHVWFKSPGTSADAALTIAASTGQTPMLSGNALNPAVNSAAAATNIQIFGPTTVFTTDSDYFDLLLLDASGVPAGAIATESFNLTMSPANGTFTSGTVVNVNTGDSSGGFDYDGTSAQASQSLTATDDGGGGAALGAANVVVNVVDPGPATYARIEYATQNDPQQNTCFEFKIVSFAVYNGGGKAPRAYPTAQLDYNLSHTAGAGTFYANSTDCNTPANPITSISQTSGELEKSVWFKTSDAVTTNISITIDEINNGGDFDFTESYVVQSI